MNDRKIDSSIVVLKNYRRNESSDVVKAKLQNMQSKKQLDWYKVQLFSFILV